MSSHNRLLGTTETESNPFYVTIPRRVAFVITAVSGSPVEISLQARMRGVVGAPWLRVVTDSTTGIGPVLADGGVFPLDLLPQLEYRIVADQAGPSVMIAGPGVQIVQSSS